MTSASDELRAAATRLRERAQRAGQGIGTVIRKGTRDLFGNVRPDPAAMDPHVGTLLADVFEAWARIGELDPDLLNRVGGPETLAIARAINTGGQP